jgi:hypothetical protein
MTDLPLCDFDARIFNMATIKGHTLAWDPIINIALFGNCTQSENTDHYITITISKELEDRQQNIKSSEIAAGL